MFVLVVPDHDNLDIASYQIRENYVTALFQAGGQPVIVPYMAAEKEDYFHWACGLMMTGGGFTIDPQLFGEEKRNPLPVKSYRTKSELAFFHKAYALKMPILGICAGAQLINVALGGGIIQHLPTSHPHILSHAGSTTMENHPIHISPGTLLSFVVDSAKTFTVNSSHVQAIGALGRDIRVNALAPDGIIEGIESTQHPFCLGLQWHPEYYSHPHYDPLIFQHFVRACHAYRESMYHKASA